METKPSETKVTGPPAAKVADTNLVSPRRAPGETVIEDKMAQIPTPKTTESTRRQSPRRSRLWRACCRTQGTPRSSASRPTMPLRPKGRTGKDALFRQTSEAKTGTVAWASLADDPKDGLGRNIHPDQHRHPQAGRRTERPVGHQRGVRPEPVLGRPAVPLAKPRRWGRSRIPSKWATNSTLLSRSSTRSPVTMTVSNRFSILRLPRRESARPLPPLSGPCSRAIRPDDRIQGRR